MLAIPSPVELRRRLPRLLGGLVLFGLGIALMVRADLGLGPWDVLHQGISERTDVPIGTVTILVGLVVLLLWIPLRERVGLGTVLNVLIIGLVADAALAVIDEPASMVVRNLTCAAPGIATAAAAASASAARRFTSAPRAAGGQAPATFDSRQKRRGARDRAAWATPQTPR